VSGDFLETMAAHSAERAASIGPIGDAELDKPLVSLQLGEFDVIAEIKDRSPAEGDLADTAVGRAERARLYRQGGAAAISVLTEPSRFAGSLQHLEEVAAAVPELPVMRKDFLVEPGQILEARRAGASGVLLIVAMLPGRRLQAMLDCAADVGMFVLLESFDGEDLGRCAAVLRDDRQQRRAAAGQLLFGVNTRNLRTLHVDPDRLQKLAAELPAGLCVAESGLHEPADAAEVARLGYRLALVGTALMRSDDPAGLVAAMRAAGATAVAA
jgi:indole-3-glycerol phosphate synthase